MDHAQLLALTADIVSAHVTNNTVAMDALPPLVERVHKALASLGTPVAEEPVAKEPVVSVRASVKPDYIVCMECGSKQKLLKRHLLTAHGMTPEQYRKDYGLADSYPLIAPAYSARRQELAKAIGLGRKSPEAAAPEPVAPEPEPVPASEPPKRRRATKKKQPSTDA